MKGGQRTGPRILAANKQRHCFGGKSRKGRQSTHEAGNYKEPSLRRRPPCYRKNTRPRRRRNSRR